MPALEELAALSRRLGAEPAYAQGGGGNTSLKDSARRMWIKASGIELATAEAATGFVPVDYPQMVQRLGACKNEADYVAAVGAAVIREDTASTKRPSIETGFHALLGKIVMHSHSVWGNLINCAMDGEALLKDMMPQALWIPYRTPGLPLTQQIAACRRGSPASVLFLQNHGVIVSGSNTDEVWSLHEEANACIQSTFNLPASYRPPAKAYEADAAHILFPDQAVYLGHDALRHSKAGVETQQAYDFLRATMDGLKLQPHFLPEAEAATLLNMEAEKYRQRVAQS